MSGVPGITVLKGGLLASAGLTPSEIETLVDQIDALNRKSPNAVTRP